MANYMDWTHLERRLANTRSRHAYLNNPQAFCHVVLEALFSLESDEIKESITDGQGDRGVDAVLIRRDRDPKEIHFFQFKCHSEFKSVNKNFPSSEIDKILTFLEDLLNKNDKILSSCNRALKNKIVEVYEILDDSRPSIFVHFCSNADVLVKSERERLDQRLLQLGGILTQEHSISNIVNLFLESSRPKINKKIRISGSASLQKSDGNIRGLVATVDALEIAKFVEKTINEDKRVKRIVNTELFHDNVRIFLGFRSEINNSIIMSALSDRNYEFWYLNNGITMICDHFSYQPNLKNAPIALEDVQIVNGAQTSSALFEAYLENPKVLESVSILVRIYETRDKSIAQRVAEATNSQNRINSRNLKSNHKIQVQLKNIMKDRGYFYETKPGEHQGCDPEKHIDSFILGQCILAYNMEQPDRAKSSSDKIFGVYYEEIFHENMNIDESIGIYNIMKKIEVICNSIIPKSYRDSRYETKQIITYARFHILYAVKLLIQRRGETVFSSDIAKLINNAVEIIEDVVFRNNKLSLYEIFRNPKTVRMIQERAEDRQPDLFSSHRL